MKLEEYWKTETFRENMKKCKEASVKVQQEKKIKRKREYEFNPKHCLQCKVKIEYKDKSVKKFCNNSCAAKYSNSKREPRSLESRQKTSKTLRQTLGLLPLPLKIKERKNIKKQKKQIKQGMSKKQHSLKKPFTNCVICAKEKQSYTKTCSKECYKELCRYKALRQEKHGGGKRGKYKGFNCDSTYELVFLIYCLDHGLPIQRSSLKIEYIYKGSSRLYNPDFEIGDKVYEIKGFNCEKSKVKLNAAKQQGYDILLIDGVEIKKYFDYVVEKYKVKKTRVFELYEVREIKTKQCLNCFNSFEYRWVKSQVFCSKKCSCVYREQSRKKNNYYKYK